MSQYVFDELVLAVIALKKSVFGAGLLGQSLGKVDEGLGLFLGEGHEVTPPDLEDAIDEAFESRPVGDGQVALEDDAVKTREHSDDQAGKLDDETRKRLHGVLLQGGCLDNTILKAECRFCSCFFCCGSAALGLANYEYPDPGGARNPFPALTSKIATLRPMMSIIKLRNRKPLRNP